MGQFLAIGLAIKIGVEKKEVDKAQLNIEQLQEKMKQELHYIPEIYVASEDSGFLNMGRTTGGKIYHRAT